MKHVINSLLDTDFYKLTMLSVMFHRYTNVHSKYRFKCRSDIDLLPYADEISEEIDKLCTVRFTNEELEYLRTKSFFTDDFIDFLEDYKPKRKYVHIAETDGKLDIWFDGPVIQVMLFEIYVMKIVNEVYFRNTQPNPNYDGAMVKLNSKIMKIKDYLGIDDTFAGDVESDRFPTRSFQFADFGSRRAFSGEHHRNVVAKLVAELPRDVFIGTSNVLLAMEFGITAIGTTGHEYHQMFQGLGVCAVEDSQLYSFKVWQNEYDGELGIALSDTLGVDMFLKDFNKGLASAYDGVRHDSTPPKEFADRIINHYQSLGINPMTKTIVFSDGLDIDLALELADYCKNRIKVSFGIGTNLTNDFDEFSALQIVIKMVECGYFGEHMRPVAKMAEGKNMCESDDYVSYLKYIIDRKLSLN